MNKKHAEKWYHSDIFVAVCLLMILVLTIIPIDVLILRNFSGVDGQELISNIVVESHGLIFDVLFIAIIIQIFSNRRARKAEIRRYIEEIDDYRSWNEKEAAYRIAGNIRRLQKRGITEIDLSFCNLEGMNLEGVDLSGSNLESACLRNASLRGGNFSGVKLVSANLSGAIIDNADFTGATVSRRNLMEKAVVLLDTSTHGGGYRDFRGSGLEPSRMPNVEDVSGWESAKLDDAFKSYVRSVNLK